MWSNVLRDFCRHREGGRMQYQPPSGNLPQPDMPPPLPLVNFRPLSRMPWVLTVAVAAEDDDEDD